MSARPPDDAGMSPEARDAGELALGRALGRAPPQAGEQWQGAEGSGRHMPNPQQPPPQQPSPIAHVQWPEPDGSKPDASRPAGPRLHGAEEARGGQPGPAETDGQGAGNGRASGLPGFGVSPAGAGASSPLSRTLHLVSRLPRLALRVPILIYRYTLSSFMGRQCRYLPTCSAYADEAISRHGAWPGLFMTTARICRCHPWGGYGYDPVPQCLPVQGRWYAPWRYGLWRMPPPSADDGG